MSAADLESGLRAFLLADADVAGASGGRVFAGELPARETGEMPRTAIVIRSSGGASIAGEGTAEHDTRRVDLFAYGATPREAGQVMADAALALKRLRRSVHDGVLLHWANSAGGSATGREPNTEWPRAFQSFQIYHALETVE